MLEECFLFWQLSNLLNMRARRPRRSACRPAPPKAATRAEKWITTRTRTTCLFEKLPRRAPNWHYTTGLHRGLAKRKPCQLSASVWSGSYCKPAETRARPCLRQKAWLVPPPYKTAQYCNCNYIGPFLRILLLLQSVGRSQA